MEIKKTSTSERVMSGVHADLGLHIGAGDENRTRTISLGICCITAVSSPELPIRVSASDRGRLSFTGVNGTLMAR